MLSLSFRLTLKLLRIVEIWVTVRDCSARLAVLMPVKAHLVDKRILELVLRIHLIVYRIIVEIEIILRAGRLFRNSGEPWQQ